MNECFYEYKSFLYLLNVILQQLPTCTLFSSREVDGHEVHSTRGSPSHSDWLKSEKGGCWNGLFLKLFLSMVILCESQKKIIAGRRLSGSWNFTEQLSTGTHLTIPIFISAWDPEDGDFVSVPGQCFPLFILRSSNSWLSITALANSNPLLTRSNFHFLTGHALYNFTLDTFYYFPWFFELSETFRGHRTAVLVWERVRV